jgi:hypothetical protein
MHCCGNTAIKTGVGPSSGQTWRRSHFGIVGVAVDALPNFPGSLKHAAGLVDGQEKRLAMGGKLIFMQPCIFHQ